jgi:hypothetical protein
MKVLCFSLLLTQQSREALTPPLHIQELIKKRILHQLKQEDLDLNLYFDNAQCEVLGNYQYTENFFQVSSSSLKQEVQLEYSNIIEGRKLNLENIKELIENKKTLALLSTKSITQKNSNKKSWLPWIIGGAVIAIGTLFLGTPNETKGENQRARRF